MGNQRSGCDEDSGVLEDGGRPHQGVKKFRLRGDAKMHARRLCNGWLLSRQRPWYLVVHGDPLFATTLISSSRSPISSPCSGVQEATIIQIYARKHEQRQRNCRRGVIGAAAKD